MLVAYTWRSRIPFATVMLNTVTNVTGIFKGTIVIGFAGLLVQIIWLLLFAATTTGVILRFSKETHTVCRPGRNGHEVCRVIISPAAYSVSLFCLFSFYWTSQVIKNVVHVTVSGVFGVYYFLYNTPNMPSGSVTMGALYRSMTTSFGSICFGSLLIAIIRFLRALAQSLQDRNNNEGALAIIACIAVCILGCIESLIEYFNQYAFAHVAIYGKPFCQAGKDTWNMILDRGIEAIINDNLVGNVLGMLSILAGVINAVLCYVYCLLLSPAIIGNKPLLWGCLVAAFFIGLAFMIVIAEVVESGITTTFVALGEDPQALARNQPALFEQIRSTWPRVVVGING